MVKSSESRILSREAMKAKREDLRKAGKSVAFTNGCFDILHAGHVEYLNWARAQADVLVVGLNSDRSVRGIKGDKRPLVGQEDRAAVLASLRVVDYVVIFDEDEPAALIEQLLPDVLVKGEDWAHYVSGRETVEEHGGRVALAPLVEGKSTTDIIENILKLYSNTG